LLPIYNSIMNKASTLKGTKGILGMGTKTIANVTDIKNIPEEAMIEIRAGLDNLYTACGNIQNDIKTLKNQLPQTGKGAIDDSKFNANSVKALYHVFSQSALFKAPIESYYAILSNPDLIKNFQLTNKKKSANGTKELGKFVEQKTIDGELKSFLSDVIFSKIAIGAYDNPALPNQLTKNAYQGWYVQGQQQQGAQVTSTGTVPTVVSGVQQQQQTGGPARALARAPAPAPAPGPAPAPAPGPATGVQQHQPQQQQTGAPGTTPVLNPGAKLFTPKRSTGQGVPLTATGGPGQGGPVSPGKVIGTRQPKFKKGQEVLNAKNRTKMYNIINVQQDGRYKIRPKSATDNKSNTVVGENNISEVTKPPPLRKK